MAFCIFAHIYSFEAMGNVAQEFQPLLTFINN